MFRFAVLLAAALLMTGPAQADETMVKKLKNFNECPGCDLAGADLSGANLFKANLFKANLAGANLRGANLRWANLKGAYLQGANLSGADLTRANFTGANFSCEIRCTNLSGADLTGAKNLKDAAGFFSATLCKTKTPYGLDNTGCKKK